MKMKKCHKCKESKELTQFGNRKVSRDGLNGTCKPCINARKKELSLKNKKDDTIIKKTKYGYIRELYMCNVLRVKSWFNHDGQLHRLNNPAQLIYDGKGELISSMTFINGKRVEAYVKPTFTSDGYRKG